MLLKLSQLPSALELEFFAQLLSSDDIVLVHSAALPMIFNALPLACQAAVLEQDAEKIGGKANAAWQQISQLELLSLIEHHKTLSW
ncbi:hypothetical protein [Reinekea thalattae]|uniref:Sulfurtransferase complex subunit TusB n=1 Tax=Reinekea thalattae TaxID=2593301 RepID=A0A5C8Z823_9GAMM|nr:hypothetical protein [Reinekea thalattae]TXR53469.1 hypothetical protein FME95_02555 [Reinekea thalattae]